MITAKPLQGADRAAAQFRRECCQRLIGFNTFTASISEFESWPACRAGCWLSVKAPIARIVILRAAIGAHLEFRHRGLLAVVGRAFDDRQPRTAIGAVEKGITVAAVGRV